MNSYWISSSTSSSSNRVLKTRNSIRPNDFDFFFINYCCKKKCELSNKLNFRVGICLHIQGIVNEGNK